jgi:hypothetical protein
MVADSGFAASLSLEEFRGINALLTVALSTSNSCGLQDLYRLGSEELPLQRSRTFACPSTVVQLVNGGEHVTGIATTAWKAAVQPPTQPPPLVKYKTALYLWEHESLATIKTIFKLPNNAPLGDPVALVKLATGHDISLPEPDPQGKVEVTEATLQKMKVSQLKLLHARTRGCKKISNKAGDELIADILKHHPLALLAQDTDPAPRARAVDLSALRSAIRGPTSDDASIIEFYNDTYGWIDHLDRGYYTTFQTAGHQHWQKLFIFSELFLVVQNAWAAYCEHLCARAASQARDSRTAARDTALPSLVAYIKSVVKQVHAAK